MKSVLKIGKYYLVDGEEYKCISLNAICNMTGKGNYVKFMSKQAADSDDGKYYKLIPHSELWRIRKIIKFKVKLY